MQKTRWMLALLSLVLVLGLGGCDDKPAADVPPSGGASRVFAYVYTYEW